MLLNIDLYIRPTIYGTSKNSTLCLVYIIKGTFYIKNQNLESTICISEDIHTSPLLLHNLNNSMRHAHATQMPFYKVCKAHVIPLMMHLFKAFHQVECLLIKYLPQQLNSSTYLVLTKTSTMFIVYSVTQSRHSPLRVFHSHWDGSG